jgi:2-aminoadipate transaminase
MLEKILDRRHDAGSNYLAAAIAAEFYQDGIQKHAKATNPVLKAKRDLTLQGLEAELGDICVWSEPVGGLFIWVRLPEDVDTKALRPMALEQGLNYLPGQSFHYQRAHVPYLRLAFGHLTMDQISEGLPVLARCIKSCRGSNEARDFDTLFN